MSPMLSGGQEQDELENEIGQCGFGKEREPESKIGTFQVFIA